MIVRTHVVLLAIKCSLCNAQYNKVPGPDRLHASLCTCLPAYFAFLIGFIACSGIVWIASCVSHCYCLWCLDAMLRSVERDAISNHAQKGLRSIRYSTLISWNVFPVVDALKETSLFSRASMELGMLFVNFYTKVSGSQVESADQTAFQRCTILPSHAAIAP